MNKNYSAWFNRYGIDECYGEVSGERFDSEMFERLKKVVKKFNLGEIEEYELEEEGDGWKMYSYDGVGIFEVEEGYSVEKCKEEYEGLVV